MSFIEGNAAATAEETRSSDVVEGGRRGGPAGGGRRPGRGRGRCRASARSFAPNRTRTREVRPAQRMNG